MTDGVGSIVGVPQELVVLLAVGGFLVLAVTALVLTLLLRRRPPWQR